MIRGLRKAFVVTKNMIVGGVDLLLLDGDSHANSPRSSHEKTNNDDSDRVFATFIDATSNGIPNYSMTVPLPGETQFEYEERVLVDNAFASSLGSDDALSPDLTLEFTFFDNDDKSKF